jgi:hypothetical protein
VHSIKVVGTIEALYHIISNNPRLGDGVGLLVFLFNSNSEKLYVLAPCTHIYGQYSSAALIKNCDKLQNFSGNN